MCYNEKKDLRGACGICLYRRLRDRVHLMPPDWRLQVPGEPERGQRKPMAGAG